MGQAEPQALGQRPKSFLLLHVPLTIKLGDKLLWANDLLTKKSPVSQKEAHRR